MLKRCSLGTSSTQHSLGFVYYIQCKTMDVTIGKLQDKLAAEGIKEMKCLLIFFGVFQWKHLCLLLCQHSFLGLMLV